MTDYTIYTNPTIVTLKSGFTLSFQRKGCYLFLDIIATRLRVESIPKIVDEFCYERRLTSILGHYVNRLYIDDDGNEHIVISAIIDGWENNVNLEKPTIQEKLDDIIESLQHLRSRLMDGSLKTVDPDILD